MEKIITARVTENLLGKYILEDKNNNKYEAILTGNVKSKNSVLIGDMVEFNKSYDKYTIRKVLPRKNSLIRPPVSNIDNLVIMLSVASPSPDYILLDKQIILCKSKNITPVICVNKTDLLENTEEAKEELNYIMKVYTNLGIKVIYTSTVKKEGMDKLKEVLRRKVSAFSGNSGVGKSSITKEILGCKNEEILIGKVGEKTNKGKHTTKYVKLYSLQDNTYILDTPGFSSYELYDIDYKNLPSYYPEFKDIKCDYEDCMHVNEDISVCRVKKLVKEGIIDKKRYERYVYIYNKLKELDDKKYKR